MLSKRGALLSRLAAALVILAAAGLVLARVVRGSGETREAQAPPASSTPRDDAGPRRALPPPGPAELALVAPIQVGTTSERFQVKEIGGVRDGTFRVVFVEIDGHGRVDLDVALDDPDSVVAPATAGKYAVYYQLHRATPDDGSRLAQELARAITKNQELAPPPGLGTFHPTEKPHERL